MKLSHIQLNENLEEKILHMTPAFPYICCHVEMDTYPGGYIPWHWHDELEFIYVQRGCVEYHIKNKTITLSTGEGCFMNSNVLHMLKPEKNCHSSILQAQTFKKIFLGGFYNSIFQQKYLDPIVNCKSLEYFKFSPDIPEQAHIIDKLQLSYRIAEQQQFGYEFQIREILSSIWIALLHETQSIVSKKKIKSSVDNERIKAMISFIQGHYSEKISVEDIASCVNISERACYRCFMNTIGMTPVEYLLQYRIRMAEDLLTSSSKSITEICTIVGFNNSSYFSKVFQAVLKCTPREYRKRYFSP